MDFVAVDWGSTNFRAYRVQADVVVDRIASAAGIAVVARPALPALLAQQLAPWRDWIEGGRIPVLMAGMIGSNQGLVDAGYQLVPITLDALRVRGVAVEAPLSTEIRVRPGLAWRDGATYDVMRGEELQVLGASHLKTAGAYVLPGTHSKWIPVDRTSGRATIRAFGTMMTGELYELLLAHSLIGRGVPRDGPWDDGAFRLGIDQARDAADIIEEIFRTRARWVQGGLTHAAVPSYLSGLLIGHECASMARRYPIDGELVIVGASALAVLYQQAAAHLGLRAAVIDGEAATVRGFRSVLEGEGAGAGAGDDDG